MAENKLAELSMDFAVKVLKLTYGMKGHYSIVNQLERSATSLEPISVRLSMLTADRISLLNCKLHSRNAMKQNIGWN